MTVFFPYKGTAIRDSLDRGTGEFDLFFVSGDIKKNYSGFYKGRNGTSESLLRTSALSQTDLVGMQQQLLDEFKKKVIF
ncbi:MAG: hypothetical protein HQL58_13490 [Magnetococcales bacterium]|nr:hypothetical protein [Magnetococcales bacterium]